MIKTTKSILFALVLVLGAGNTALYAQKNNNGARKVKDAGWYMRIRISATADDGTVYTHNSAGVFGELKQSRYKKDRHDIPAYGAETLQVVFPHYNWEEDSGDYYSDYRKWNKKKANKRAAYTFLVKNQKGADLSNASLNIFVDPATIVKFVKEKDGNIKYTETGKDYSSLENFTLVDVDNHQTYAMDELEYANLSMDGNHTRTFRIVRGSIKKRDFKPLEMPE